MLTGQIYSQRYARRMLAAYKRDRFNRLCSTIAIGIIGAGALAGFIACIAV